MSTLKDNPNNVAESEGSYFDSFVSSEGEFNPFLERGWNTIRRRFIEMVSPKENSALLDVGCGTGQSFQLYDGYVSQRYVGIDLSQEALNRAKTRLPTQEWIHADACALPFADETFDIVAFSSVLHHIPDYGLAIAEARRVLKPGGKVFAFDPNILHPAMALFRNPESKFYNPVGVSPNERPLHPNALRSAFEAANLTNIKQRAQSDIPYRAVGPKEMNRFLALYNIGDRLWEGIGLGKRYGTFVITVGQKS